MVSFRPLDLRLDLPSLLAFSEHAYGKSAYQASERYIHWLYEEHPVARGPEDCLLAVDGKAVVGCIHRMPLPGRHGEQRFIFVSLQNHIVDKRVRGGAGLLLLRQAVRGEQAVFSPGVSGRLSEAYRRLGYMPIEGFWLIRYIAPISGVLQLVRAKLGQEELPILRSAQFTCLSSRIQTSISPEDALIERLTAVMNRQAVASRGLTIEWTPELVRWRYFSEKGPRHILVGKASSSWAVLSFGVRLGVSVVRLLEYEDGGDHRFMADVVAVARAAGAAVMSSFTVVPTFRDKLLRGGWRRRSDAAVSFLMGPLAANGLSASAGMSDFGFEAIRTEVV
jgi:hypothetical protein